MQDKFFSKCFAINHQFEIAEKKNKLIKTNSVQNLSTAVNRLVYFKTLKILPQDKKYSQTKT